MKITNEQIIKVLDESYNLIDTLASANPWCDEVDDKINDVVNQIVDLKRKLEEENK